MNLKLFITFLVLPFCGKAQISTDTTHEILSIYLYRHPGFVSSTKSHTTDTVKCIMLVCDTSAQYTYIITDVGYTLPPKILKYDSVKVATDYSVFWQIGYVYHTDGFRAEYLDENKKPLSKNIIVWMSKNTEQ